MNHTLWPKWVLLDLDLASDYLWFPFTLLSPLLLESRCSEDCSFCSRKRKTILALCVFLIIHSEAKFTCPCPYLITYSVYFFIAHFIIWQNIFYIFFYCLSPSSKIKIPWYFISIRMLLSKRQEITIVGKDVEKRESLCTVIGM